MLEQYFVKPSTIDRIRASWLAPQVERYVEWMQAQGYADRNVFRRVPLLCHFADFARQRGATDLTSAALQVGEFASCWVDRHGVNSKTTKARPKFLYDAQNPVRQMPQLALDGHVRPKRQHKSLLLEAQVPRFFEYLREERGLRESTIYRYVHDLNRFAAYLKRVGINSLGELSPALLASFVVDSAPGLARTSRRDLCAELRVFLYFCYRERIIREP
ncbi:MAG TPA: site-specific integrase [Edaphobacter sp.]|uniref:site-specific integrase n=1 Tax=Edaphobacter sp. TaxID=1934404 RepID=UPI002CF8F0C7|nr:site-specific integrase [Edaphobacter sp.]HUZ96687.1 site-specific integrase [Edaphobacter sp.]